MVNGIHTPYVRNGNKLVSENFIAVSPPLVYRSSYKYGIYFPSLFNEHSNTCVCYQCLITKFLDLYIQ